MRNITKILLLIVVAFVAFLLFPRKSDLKAFQPAALAALQIDEWTAEKSGGGLMARYKIFANQYHFAPVTAFRMAQTQGSAMSKIAEAKKPGANPTDEERALASLREKYAMMKEGLNASFDADALAREEFGWRIAEQDPATSVEAIVPPMCRILVVLYGGAPEDFTQVATDLASARAVILSGQGELANAKENARAGYDLLHEIALAPVENPTPSP